ncbi:MAG: TatD family hydrolase [Clostridia bacterium]|nr:TatD family hydrolase [Clostridia bacterium]
MLTGIFDTHAHYDDAKFDDDRDAVLAALPGRGVVRVINCGVSLATSKTSLALAHRYDYIYAAIGIHPEDCGDAKDSDYDALLPLYNDPKVVAVGEIGLDYYWDSVPKDVQLAAFKRQLILANDLHLPVIIHDREAHADTFALLHKHRPQGVLHCFSGSAELAKEALSLGLYIGLGGAATFKNARKAVEVAAMLPADRLLLETDAPYMAPVPHRGKRNDSSLIVHVAERLGEIRGEDPQQIVDRCRENAERLFQLKSES